MKIKVTVIAEIDKQGNILRIMRKIKSCRGGPILSTGLFTVSCSLPAHELIKTHFNLERFSKEAEEKRIGGVRREVGQ